jgi:hypothetical protein
MNFLKILVMKLNLNLMPKNHNEKKKFFFKNFSKKMNFLKILVKKK